MAGVGYSSLENDGVFCIGSHDAGATRSAVFVLYIIPMCSEVQPWKCSFRANLHGSRGHLRACEGDQKTLALLLEHLLACVVAPACVWAVFLRGRACLCVCVCACVFVCVFARVLVISWLLARLLRLPCSLFVVQVRVSDSCALCMPYERSLVCHCANYCHSRAFATRAVDLLQFLANVVFKALSPNCGSLVVVWQV